MKRVQVMSVIACIPAAMMAQRASFWPSDTPKRKHGKLQALA